MPDLFRVRTAVTENHLSAEQLDRHGITHASVAAMLAGDDAAAWVAEADGVVVGFSMAVRSERTVFALFVLDAWQGRGVGTRLLDAAVAWLRSHGVDRPWLKTGADTRAVAFYERRGWRNCGADENGEVRFEWILR